MNILVKRNTIEDSGDDGIELVSGGANGIYLTSPSMNSMVMDNDVSRSANNGLYVSGPNHADVIVSGNTFTDNDIGAQFESGLVDLTGEGNTFDGGRIGLRFSPVQTLSGPSALELVDNTVGPQTFDGQSEYFIELDNGAFYDPGTPTVLSLNDSTFVDTPFGTFTPSVDFGGGLPDDVQAYLEANIQHFVDDNTLGLFFLEGIPELAEIDQEDVFNFFEPGAGDLGGLDVTILGLPGVNGGVAPAGIDSFALNNIAPAAGGELTPDQLNNIETAAGGEQTAEQLNNIETASGGQNTSCFNDGINVAEAGQTVRISYGGGAEALLNSESNCGASIAQ